MNTKKIYEYINHPELIDSKAFREFDEILDKYPYFQLVRILYLRALYIQNSHRFQQELKNATLYISDKKQLYLYLSGQLDIDELGNIPPLSSTDVVPEKMEHKERNQEAGDKKQQSIPSQHEELSEDILETPTEAATDKESYIADDEIIDFTVSEKDETVASTDKKDDVLDFILNEMNAEPAYTLENSLGIESDKEYDIDKLGKELNKKNKDKLLDDFIESNPNMPKPAKSDFNNINLAELDSHDDKCMTETLAKIYVKQKLYGKAIAVYKRLSLNNPQKSVYFVEKISEIKKIINDKL